MYIIIRNGRTKSWAKASKIITLWEFLYCYVRVFESENCHFPKMTDDWSNLSITIDLYYVDFINKEKARLEVGRRRI